MARNLPKLQNICVKFAIDDIHNADETGANYCTLPDRTISLAVMHSSKKSKNGLTLLYAQIFVAQIKSICFY